jgi:hypothetical protein
MSHQSTCLEPRVKGRLPRHHRRRDIRDEILQELTQYGESDCMQNESIPHHIHHSRLRRESRDAHLGLAKGCFEETADQQEKTLGCMSDHISAQSATQETVRADSVQID